MAKLTENNGAMLVFVPLSLPKGDYYPASSPGKRAAQSVYVHLTAMYGDLYSKLPDLEAMHQYKSSKLPYLGAMHSN